MRWMQYLNC
uniref:Uncharacterized protein n=3 Tax=Oryza TaxID=4527 RepID=A0A0G2KBM5_9ORYZ